MSLTLQATPTSGDTHQAHCIQEDDQVVLLDGRFLDAQDFQSLLPRLCELGGCTSAGSSAARVASEQRISSSARGRTYLALLELRVVRRSDDVLNAAQAIVEGVKPGIEGPPERRRHSAKVPAKQGTSVYKAPSRPGETSLTTSVGPDR